jgi:hypothetical protein
MKQFIYILVLMGFLNCYSQDNSTDTISNNRQPELDQMERVILERNVVIDTSKIGSYIHFYEIDNHGNGKWVNIYKGYWGEYFGNKYFSYHGQSNELLNWDEWHEKYYKKNNIGDNNTLHEIKYEGSLNGHKPNGKWTIITQGGEIVRGSFKNGLPDGEWTYSQKTKSHDGPGAVVKEIIFRKEFYLNGIPDGKWLFAYNDLITEENFVNGKPFGFRNVFYDSSHSENINTKGTLIFQSNFVDGYPDGQCYLYQYINKEKKILWAKAFYKLGKPIEFFINGGDNSSSLNENSFKTEFIENSNIVLYHIYKKGGKLVKTIEFDRSKNNFKHALFKFSYDDYSFSIWRAVKLENSELTKFGIDLNLYYE